MVEKTREITSSELMFWRVPAIWNHCVAWAGLSRYLVCKVTALEALTSALKPRESRREFEHQKSRQIAV